MLKAKKKTADRVFVRALPRGYQVRGDKLELLKDRLTELPGYHESSFPWHILFTDLLKAEAGEEQYAERIRGYGHDSNHAPNTLLLLFIKDDKKVTLGCRTFSVATYKKILKATRAHARKKS